MYKIQLPDFEGPFDLLLYFIKRDEINIYDIPISKITEEFLAYIRLIKLFDLELAGEFILMASNLMYVKTQMLLPRTKDDNGVEIEDPRTALVQKILEYKQLKEVTYDLASKSEAARYNFYRELFDAEYNQAGGDSIYKNATLFDLMKAFKTAIMRQETQELDHIIEVFTVSMEDKIATINDLLIKNPRLSFFAIVSGQSRQHIIVTFLAVLEMMKLQMIFLHQDTCFDDIFISTKFNNN